MSEKGWYRACAWLDEAKSRQDVSGVFFGAIDTYLRSVDMSISMYLSKLHKKATDLVLVGDGWWIERCEYDGSEWWEFKTIPTEKAKVVPILYLDRGMWDTLKEINEVKL